MGLRPAKPHEPAPFVGQAILPAFSTLLGWAFGPRNFMKNGHHGNGGSDEVGLAVKKLRS
jgi:hypothetical protein